LLWEKEIKAKKFPSDIDSKKAKAYTWDFFKQNKENTLIVPN